MNSEILCEGILHFFCQFVESGTETRNNVFGTWIVIRRHRQIQPFSKTEVSLM